MKGGYTVLDLEGIDLTVIEGKKTKIPGIYKKVEEANKTDKRIIVSGINADGIHYSEFESVPTNISGVWRPDDGENPGSHKEFRLNIWTINTTQAFLSIIDDDSCEVRVSPLYTDSSFATYVLPETGLPEVGESIEMLYSNGAIIYTSPGSIPATCEFTILDSNSITIFDAFYPFYGIFYPGIPEEDLSGTSYVTAIKINNITNLVNLTFKYNKVILTVIS